MQKKCLSEPKGLGLEVLIRVGAMNCLVVVDWCPQLPGRILWWWHSKGNAELYIKHVMQRHPNASLQVMMSSNFEKQITWCPNWSLESTMEVYDQGHPSNHNPPLAKKKRKCHWLAKIKPGTSCSVSWSSRVWRVLSRPTPHPLGHQTLVAPSQEGCWSPSRPWQSAFIHHAPWMPLRRPRTMDYSHYIYIYIYMYVYIYIRWLWFHTIHTLFSRCFLLVKMKISEDSNDAL